MKPSKFTRFIAPFVVFSPRYVLTPLSTKSVCLNDGDNKYSYLYVYVFGIRVAILHLDR